MDKNELQCALEYLHTPVAPRVILALLAGKVYHENIIFMARDYRSGYHGDNEIVPDWINALANGSPDNFSAVCSEARNDAFADSDWSKLSEFLEKVMEHARTSEIFCAIDIGEYRHRGGV